jgi:hypothetical protein
MQITSHIFVHIAKYLSFLVNGNGSPLTMIMCTIELVIFHLETPRARIQNHMTKGIAHSCEILKNVI